MGLRVWLLVFLNIFNAYRLISGLEREFTISVDPGHEECFYQTAKVGQLLDVEYQVIDGGHGDLDINFKMFSPTNRIVVADFKKVDATHRKEVKEFGDYKMCFDNTFSHISTKVIYFELIVEDENGDYDEEDEWKLSPGNAGSEVYEIGMEVIEDSVNRVKSNLNRVKHVQDQLKAFEARDRNIQEYNFSCVNNWSFAQIVVMLFVGCVQVVMVRSLFDDRSRIHRLWKIKT